MWILLWLWCSKEHVLWNKKIILSESFNKMIPKYELYLFHKTHAFSTQHIIIYYWRINKNFKCKLFNIIGN